MPFDTYANLQTAILGWLARPADPLLTGAVPDMIALFEAQARRRLYHRLGEQFTTLTTTPGVANVALPPFYAEARTVRINNGVIGPGGGALPSTSGTSLPDTTGAAMPSVSGGGIPGVGSSGGAIIAGSIPDTTGAGLPAAGGGTVPSVSTTGGGGSGSGAATSGHGGKINRLSYVSPEEMDSTWVGSQPGMPLVFTIEGQNIRFAPVSDSAYAIDFGYIAGIPALGSSGSATSIPSASGSGIPSAGGGSLPGVGSGIQTNWLLTNHPDVYLFGSLAEAESYIGNDERVPLWMQRRESSLTSIMQADLKARWSGSVLVMRTDTGNP